MSLREEADYGLVFSEEGATSIVNNAENFLNKVKQILHNIVAILTNEGKLCRYQYAQKRPHQRNNCNDYFFTSFYFGQKIFFYPTFGVFSK